MDAVAQIRMRAELSTLPLPDLARMVRRQEWLTTARPDQLRPSDGFIWLLLAGRGSGKTRAGAEEVWWPASITPQRVAVVGPTSNDVRKTCFEGESGLLAVIPKEIVANYNRTSLEMWLTNGSYFVGYSSEEPERLRGPQHHRAWCDELASWKYLEDTWDMLQFGLRLGASPDVVVTTTPKPSQVLKDILADEDTRVSRASMYDNEGNLPAKFLERIRKKYEGTRLGRQEIYADLLDDNPYALWKRANIDKTRVVKMPEDVVRLVVAIDPPVTTGEDADECGIVVAARTTDGHYWVLDDATCQGLSPAGWAGEAVRRWRSFRADCIVAEVNNGGQMIEDTIKNVESRATVMQVRATRGKVLRAEPIAALYEKGLVHHVGHFSSLEDQMCEFTTDFDKKIMGYSPDRVDALVWAMTELSEGAGYGMLSVS